MRINIVLTLIAIVLSLLLGYWVYSIAGTDIYATLAGVSSAICFAIPLILALGVRYNTSSAVVNMRAISSVFLIIMLVLHFYYAATGINMPYYVIINGILICVYVVIVYAIIKSKQ